MNNLDGYIKNRLKIEKVNVICNLLFWILNLVFLQLAINMLTKIIYSGRSKWLINALKEEMKNDAFIVNQTESIIISMTVILFVVVAFSLATLVLYRNIQLRNMLVQFGVYTTVGYSKKKIVHIGIREAIFNIVVAIPVSLLFTDMAWRLLSKNELIKTLLLLMENKWWMDMLSYIISLCLMTVTLFIHTGWYVHKSNKKGIRYMLGKGI